MATNPPMRTGEKRPGIKPRPLTRRNSEGSLYKRDPKVEDQIITSLSSDPASLKKRASIGDQKSQDFLKEEAIVCLIREYLLRKDKPLVNALFEILFRRCSKRIKDKFRSLDSVLADEAYHEVVEDMVDSILDFTKDDGDYFQVRFWSAIRRRSIDIYRKYLAEQRKRAKEAPPGEDGEAFEIEKEIQDPSMSEEDRYLYREGLKILPEPIRTAFVLRHYFGWQIESDDPDEITISVYFKKTPKTMRNWFSQAQEILSQWRGEKERRP